MRAQTNHANPERPLAITNITVIDPKSGSVKRDVTVLVRGGRIATVGKSNTVRIPSATQTVEGRGKFLVPGLWDMHVHLDSGDFGRNHYLRLLIVNGVTGVRLMDGDPIYHQWRREIERGLLLGPRMVIASQVIAGPASYASDALKVRNAEEARAAVRKAKQERADFIKVHDGLSRAAYFTIVEEAKKLKITISGHVPEAIKAIEASNAGQRSIEHFTGLTEAETDLANANLLSSVFKKNDTWLCPTLIMRRNYAVLDERFLAEDTRGRYASRSLRAYWSKVSRDAKNIPASDWAARRETVRREKTLVGRFHKTGVGILAGTDTSNPYVMPGFGLHDELLMLVESGLTPMQALQAATLNPARFFNQTTLFGSVEIGKAADLLLLNANPLEDIRNTTKISAVVVQGRFLDRQELDRILAEIEAAAA
ncbi:MAG: amidohydrolase family protein [Pyrinomonadaceae bacterium]